MPGGEGVVVRVGRLGAVEGDVEAEQHAAVGRHDLARRERRRAGIAHALEAGEGLQDVAPAGNLEAGDIKLAVDGVDGAVEGRRGEVADDADDAGLRAGAAVVPEDAEEVGLVEADLDHLVVERPHLGVGQPDLGQRRGVRRVRDPGEGVGDGSGVFLLGQLVAQESVELGVLDDVDRRARHVVALLVAGDDEAGARVHGEVGLAEAVAEHGGGAAVGRDAQDAAVVLADGGRFLAALGDDEFALRREAQGAGEFAHVRRLGEGVREEFVDVGFAVAVRVEEPPDAVAVEDVDLVVAERAGHRLMQARGEAAPADFVAGGAEAAGEPDVPVDRHQHAGAILAELDVAGADGAFPGVDDRQADVVDDVGVGGFAEFDLRGDGGLPAGLGRAGRDGDRRDGRGGVLVAEGHAERGGRVVGGNLHREEIFVMGEFGRAADRHAGFDFLGRPLMARADDEEQVLGVGGDRKVAFDHDLAVMLGGLPELTDDRVVDAIGEHDVLADEFHGLELTQRGRQRAASDFIDRGRRGAWVIAIDRRAELPAGDDRMAEPELAFGLRSRELAAERLAARVVIGTRGEGFVADALASPDGGDAEQIGVEARPAVVGQLDDQAARGEVVLAEAFAAGVEDGREEREVGLDPGAPGLRIILGGLVLRFGG